VPGSGCALAFVMLFLAIPIVALTRAVLYRLVSDLIGTPAVLTDALEVVAAFEFLIAFTPVFAISAMVAPIPISTIALRLGISGWAKATLTGCILGQVARLITVRRHLNILAASVGRFLGFLFCKLETGLPPSRRNRISSATNSNMLYRSLTNGEVNVVSQ